MKLFVNKKIIPLFLALTLVSVAGKALALETAQANFEIGQTTLNHNWKKISLSKNYLNPVVIAQPLSYNGSDPAHIRLRNVTTNSFEMKIEEWSYLDRIHTQETISYIVVDSGVYEINGLKIEAGTLITNDRWKNQIFRQNFSVKPILFTQSQTDNDSEPVVVRNKVGLGGFDVRLQEEEAKGSHSSEIIGYLAIEPGTIFYNEEKIKIGSIGGVTDKWKTFSFGSAFPSAIFIANMQTYNGPDTAELRYANLTESSVQIKVEEEQSKDAEVSHTKEDVGYIVISKLISQDPTNHFYDALRVFENYSVYSEPGYYVWDPQVIFDNGFYYLIYSRWPESSGWGGYRTNGEICVAKSSDPVKGFVHQAVILKAANVGWDDGSVHSARLLKDGNNWRLYYVGFDADGAWAPAYKQIGVATTSEAISDWNINSFTRSSKNPIIQIGADQTLWNGWSVANPAPLLENGIYKLWFKGETKNANGVIVRNLGYATATSWDGPYVQYEKNPLLVTSGTLGIEDYFIWNDGISYKMVLKNVDTLRGEWYQSSDGINWSVGPNNVIAYQQSQWGNDAQLVDRPFVYFDENGLKKYLYASKKPFTGLSVIVYGYFEF